MLANVIFVCILHALQITFLFDSQRNHNYIYVCLNFFCILSILCCVIVLCRWNNSKRRFWTGSELIVSSWIQFTMPFSLLLQQFPVVLRLQFADLYPVCHHRVPPSFRLFLLCRCVYALSHSETRLTLVPAQGGVTSHAACTVAYSGQSYRVDLLIRCNSNVSVINRTSTVASDVNWALQTTVMLSVYLHQAELTTLCDHRLPVAKFICKCRIWHRVSEASDLNFVDTRISLQHGMIGGRQGRIQEFALGGVPSPGPCGGVLALLSVWSEVRTCIWPSWCYCHSLQ